LFDATLKDSAFYIHILPSLHKNREIIPYFIYIEIFFRNFHPDSFIQSTAATSLPSSLKSKQTGIVSLDNTVRAI
jgi:hypothetical protein